VDLAEPPLVEINAFAFSADGKTLAAASNASRVLLCDLTTGKFDRALAGGHVEWVSDVDFSPDGDRLCSVSGDGTIAIWDWKSGERLQRFRGHTKELRSARFSRDGQHVITGGQEGMVQIWNLHSETVVASIDEPELKPGRHAVWPRDIALSADGTRLAVCWDAGGLKVYDIADLTKPVLLESFFQETGNQVHFITDDRLAVGSTYGEGRIWTLGRQQPDRKLRGHRDRIVAVTGTPDGRTVATASRDHSIRLWPAEAGPEGKELASVPGRSNKLVLSPAGDEILLQLSEPSRCALVRTDSGEVISEVPGWDGAHAAAYVSDGRGLALAVDSTVSVYDRTGRTFAFSWRWTHPKSSQPGGRIGDLWSSTKQLIATAGHELWVVDLDKRNLAWHRNLGDGLWDVAISPDEQFIYVGNQTGKIHELLATDGTTSRVLQGPIVPVKALCISSDGRLLLSGFENREIRLWDRAQGTTVGNLASQEEHLGAAQFTRDGKTAIGNYESHLDFWHVASGQRLIATGPWSSKQVMWDLSADSRTLYLAVHQDGQESIRAINLDDREHRPTAAQTAPSLPD
jgi:WD40 repeat protein